ncbi:MAG: hypothetical protein J6F30_15130 [Cellulosilyticum sp.]|nr:hypothetical protein [Cellulosilyticum sp.]
MATAFDLPINDLEKFKFMPTISGDGKILYYVSIPLNAMADSIDLKAKASL